MLAFLIILCVVTALVTIALFSEDENGKGAISLIICIVCAIFTIHAYSTYPEKIERYYETDFDIISICESPDVMEKLEIYQKSNDEIPDYVLYYKEGINIFGKYFSEWEGYRLYTTEEREAELNLKWAMEKINQEQEHLAETGKFADYNTKKIG